MTLPDNARPGSISQDRQTTGDLRKPHTSYRSSPAVLEAPTSGLRSPVLPCRLRVYRAQDAARRAVQRSLQKLSCGIMANSKVIGPW